MSPADLTYGPDGLLPVILQDARSGAVLTLAYANREAVELTIAERATVLYSRSRKALWRKGETSGHTQEVVSVQYDCDADALLYRVVPSGPACHTGATSCFNERLDAGTGALPESGSFARALAHLSETFRSRKAEVADGSAPSESYVAKMLRGGVDRIGKKVGEEATEVVIAAKNNDPAELTWEVADLLFHTTLLLEERGVSLDDVGAELLRRAKPSPESR